MLIKLQSGGEVLVAVEDFVFTRSGNYDPDSDWEFAYDMCTGRVYGREVAIPILGISPRDGDKLPMYWGEASKITQHTHGYVTERTYASLCSAFGEEGYVRMLDASRRVAFFRPLIADIGTPRVSEPPYRSTFVGARTLGQCYRYARYGRDWRVVSVEVDYTRLGVFAVTRGLRELQAVITCWCGEDVDVSPLEAEVFGTEAFDDD